MFPLPISQAKTSMVIFALFGGVPCIARWNPDLRRHPKPFWEPFPQLANPYNELWVRAHQPVEFRDVAEILAATPAPIVPKPIDNGIPPAPIVVPPIVVTPPAPIPAPPPGVIMITDIFGTVVVECDFEPAKIRNYPKPLVNGVAIPYAASDIIRDAIGVKRARVKFVMPAMPAEVSFIDTVVVPPRIT